jgi:hypothetical protein
VLGDRRLGQQLVEPGDQLPDDRPDGVDVRAVVSGWSASISA